MRALHEWQLDVHPVDARHERRQHDDDRDGREVFHHVVEVVRDDGSKRVERTAEDVAVDGCHLLGLGVFDRNILQHVVVGVGDFDQTGMFDATDEEVVGLKGGREVDEGLLDVHQAHEGFVRDRLVEILLDHIGALPDVAEIAEIEDGGMPEDLEGEPKLGFRGTDTANLVEDRAGDRREPVTDGQDVILGQDDTQRDGVERDQILMRFVVRDMDNDLGTPLVAFQTRSFILVERIGDKLARSAGKFLDTVDLFARRVCKIDPASPRERVDFTKNSVFPMINRDHTAPFVCTGTFYSRLGGKAREIFTFLLATFVCIWYCSFCLFFRVWFCVVRMD